MVYPGIVLALACIAIFAMAGGAKAAAGGAKAAAGGDVEQYRVGDATVWAIADSTGFRDGSIFPSVDPELFKQYAPTGKIPTGVMVFAIQSGGDLALIDAGMGSPSGDRASKLMIGMAKAGLDPAQVKTILITHMHIDHIGGLLWEGKIAFPNARVLIGKVEYDFWLDPKSVERYPQRKATFEQAGQIMDACKGRVDTFAFGDEVLPGIRAIDAIGHTPGHTAFMLESAGGKMLFVGDLLHAADLQFPRPDINANFDMIPDKAAAARSGFLEKAAVDKLPIAGIHLAFPGVVRVEKAGANGYAYTSGL